MTVRELRQKYLDFFKSKGHDVHPSGSLVPVDVTGKLDQSLLFNGAGMVQFKPYFRGIAKPSNPRLTTAQKCLRTGDIDEVGDLSHLTFFEMLGNFSFGDYFKAEAINYSWEFLTSKDWLGLDPKMLAFTVFEEDDEAYNLWAENFKSVGIDPETRIFRLDEKTNYWPAGAFSSGPPGPCGPNSEMFFWTGEGDPPTGPYTAEDYIRDDKAGNWMEIWNDVFIQYEWQGDLKDPARPDKGYEKSGMPELPFRSVDTGMGIERTVAVLAGKTSVYDTDAFTAVFQMLKELSDGRLIYGQGHEKENIAMRIVADHLRAACFCIADGVLPSNTGRGYVLRRLIRRAVLKGARTLAFEDPFLHLTAQSVIAEFGQHYHELMDKSAVITETLKNEETQFRRTLSEGEDMFENWLLTQYIETAVATSSIFYLVATIEETPPQFYSIRKALDKSVEDAQREASTLRNSTKLNDFVNESVRESKSAIETYRSRVSSLEGEKIDLDASAKLAESRIPSHRGLLEGRFAFHLYDTYGFPLEVTQEIAAEAGVEVDVEGFRQAMQEAQERSRAASGMDIVYGTVHLVFQTDDGQATPTQPLFYTSCEAEATIVGAVPLPTEEDKPNDTYEFVVALDQTPFYAESGGQVADTGTISGEGFELKVKDVTKQDTVLVHLVEALELPEKDTLKTLSPEDQQTKLNELLFNKPVTAKVDQSRRTEITRNHTATHLLHAALRKVLGEHVTQAGSLVAPDHLRFDFTHGQAMTPEQVKEVEQIVYEKVLQAQPVTIYPEKTIEEAREMGAMMLFGEKYGDRVRVVQIGGMPETQPSFSRELCGGIHVANTGEIGLFKIQHESSAASGVRRIVALTGHHAYNHVLNLESNLHEAATKLKSTPHDLVGAIEKLQESLREEKKKREKLAQQGAGASAIETHELGAITLKIQRMEDADPADAKAVADTLVDNNPNVVALVTNVAEGKVNFACKVGKSAQENGAKAGDLVREVAKITGGGGGGRPDFATAGGKDPSKLDEAISRAIEVVSKA